ncbi:tetratricopeptide repeat protein [Oligella urethralis]|uniref:tetratricopeptide repeat protein n=1 Tax=Oligella urethralis TaxID=90245 RepID=UPI00036948E2|nr:SEL1-like repeat protein [Oligella urethralis]SUA66281.1 Uncharacterised protein [Oligella urethralis]
MVNKYLNVLEIVTPFDVGGNGWAWKVISSAFEFYAHRKITSEKIDKLVIYILDTPPEKPLNKSPEALGVVQVRVVIDGEYFRRLDSKRELLEFAYDVFKTTVLGLVNDYDLKQDELLTVFAAFEALDFVYEGVVKKIDKELTLRWHLEKHLHYFIRMTREDEGFDDITVLEVNGGDLRHFDRFGKIKRQDNKVLIHWKKSSFYSLVDLDSHEVKVLSEKALAGDAHHQFMLAQAYFKGQYTKVNEKEGIYWLKLAAENGFSRAQNMLKKLVDD